MTRMTWVRRLGMIALLCAVMAPMGGMSCDGNMTPMGDGTGGQSNPDGTGGSQDGGSNGGSSGGSTGGAPGDGSNEPGPPSFANDVLPIFSSKCSTCHRDGGEADQEGILVRLTNAEAYASTVNQLSVQNGAWTIVKPGDSAQSLLYLKVSTDAPPVGARMPLSRPALSAADQQAIKDWIDRGAPND